MARRATTANRKGGTRRPQNKTVEARNPLLQVWRGPFAGPPFGNIEPHHFEPAFEAALSRHRTEIGSIAKNAAPPTFANTILALEKSGRLLSRVASVFFNLSSADTSNALQAIERRIAPKLARHESAIHLNRGLFRRIDDLYRRRDRLKLGAEERRVLERTHTAFVRAGARLGRKDKKRVAAINARLAELVTRFSQNVLSDEQSWHLFLEGEADLAGLPEPLRAGAAEAARALGRPGGHAITLARSSVESFLQFSERRDLREEAFKAWIGRGEARPATDNTGIVREVIALRKELARLLGYQSFAHFVLEDTMAKSPSAVRNLLDEVWWHAVRRAKEERSSLEEIALKEGGNFRLAAWDWRFYAEKERKVRFDFDEAEVRPYLELDRMIAAAFDTARRLFGLSFKESSDVPRYHPDVRAWEVKDRNGAHRGLFLGDYYARPSKRSGAWMSSYRDQHKLGKGARPIIVNVMSFSKGSDGEPALLSFDDARTLFHEFGHALHGLLSDVTYPSISGTNVPRDFVELPSQLYEHWLQRPEVMRRFAVHYRTGRPMPEGLISKLEKASTFNQGFATVEYAACAIADLELHTLEEPDGLDCGRFERELKSRIGMPPEIVMRHRIPHFLHIMGGYASAYYSYLWSEVMDADAFEAFEEAGDVFHAPTAARLREFIYAAGNRRDPLEAYVAFRGRPPAISGLMKKRGFAR